MRSGEIRQQLRRKRQALTSFQQNNSAALIADLLSHAVLFRDAKNIAAYIANDGEIDPSLILNIAANAGMRCFLPVLDPLTRNSLCFIKYDQNTLLVRNRYGIPEPIFNRQMEFDPKRLDLILMPLVGFDRTGSRIGMGGGYYDRTLAFEGGDQAPQPTLVGLAHSTQEIDFVYRETWDIPLNFIVTEKEIICVKRK